MRAEITSKEKEEEDMMEKVQKETKYESSSLCVLSLLHTVIMFRQSSDSVNCSTSQSYCCDLRDHVDTYSSGMSPD